MLIRTCMNHSTIKYGGVNSMVGKKNSTCVNINFSDYLQDGTQEDITMRNTMDLLIYRDP